jgi:hypothetical protein
MRNVKLCYLGSNLCTTDNSLARFYRSKHAASRITVIGLPEHKVQMKPSRLFEYPF